MPVADISWLISPAQTVLKEESNEAAICQRLTDIIKPHIQNPTWVDLKEYTFDPELGFDSYLLHEEPDHSLAINLLVWGPKCQVVPHDHGTWGVVGTLKGIERNYFWTRIDDGSDPNLFDLECGEPKDCHAGQTLIMPSDCVHHIENPTDDYVTSLHIYGKNLNFTGRFQYDIENKTRQPMIIDFKD